MRLEGFRVGRGRDSGHGRQHIAVDKDVIVGASSSFGSYNVRIVGQRDLVHDAHQALVPAVLVVVLCIGHPQRCVGETRLLVRNAGEVEGQLQRGDQDVDL